MRIFLLLFSIVVVLSVKSQIGFSSYAVDSLKSNYRTMGNVRDLPKLTKERYPIWCRGFNPVGVANNFTGNFPKKIMKEILSLYEGGIAVCDLTGVVAIKKKDVNEKTFWRRNCISTKKFDIIKHTSFMDSLVQLVKKRDRNIFRNS